MAETSWEIRGHILQSCNCAWGCPCNFQAPPTTGDCEGGWIIQIEQGHFNGTSLDSLNFAIFADWPGAIHQGGGEAILLIDDRANPEQREALRKIGAGEVGGPYAIFLNTYRLAPAQYVPFSVTIDGPRSKATIGEIAELELESIRNPVTGVELGPKVVLPEGMLYKDSTRYSSKNFRVRDGITYQHRGTDAAVAPIEWRNP
ncbi:MAG TPA: DUF1326 domain-containing protein [Candidatus Dormibacteraeota bacterium]|nr:DUF1326 domain-containing protein [Candidatus Dormibacteraeota bacterium]